MKGNSDKDSKKNNILKLEGYVEERTNICNPVFVNGFSKGWYFVLPEAFRDSLDIKLTSVVDKNKENYEVLTQGKNYDFKVGDTFYDTKKAYELPWKDALEYIRYSIQIIEAAPVETIIKKEIQTESEVFYLEDEKKKNEPKILYYRRKRTHYGIVRFKLFRTDSKEKRLEFVDNYQTNQELFVVLLQTGILKDKSKELINLVTKSNSD